MARTLDLGSGEIVEEAEYGPVKPPLKDDPNFIVSVFIGLIVVVVVTIFLDPVSKLFFVLAVIVYSVVCFKKIIPERKGIKVTLETPDEENMYTGGVYWQWFPFQRFYLFPTEPVIIDIPEQQVVTAEEIVTIGEKKKVYSEADIGVNAVLYFFWPDTPKGLCEAYKKAPNPFDSEKLFKFFEPSLAAMVRGVAGDFSWLKIRMNNFEYIDALQKEVLNNKKGPISKAGITDFSIENKSVKLPPTLEALITKEQEATYEKAAGIHAAELDRISKVEAGKGVADAIKRKLEVMAENPDMARLLTFEKMAEGDASTIFVEIPQELKGALSGDEIPSELAKLWNAMPKAQRTKLASKLLELSSKKK